MRIGLVAMSGVRVKSAELAALGVTLPGFIRRGKVIASLPSLGLLTVAGLTPPGHEIEYLEIDDLAQANELPQFDLVGISSLTARIEDAYRVADALRARGTRVVFGGLHASALPDEVIEHADSVVLNGAEGAWPAVVRDAERGVLKPRYVGATARVFAPEHYVVPRFDLLARRAYNRVTIQTSRGCPRDCEFCGASLRITQGFQQKPVKLVIEEIRRARQHVDHAFFELADDNTFLNKTWSREFLRVLRHEEIRYFTETDVSVADDPETCDLLAESGCRQVLIGFESPQAGDLTGIDPKAWKQSRAPEYRRVIDSLQSRGVSVNGCFILGLETQTVEAFPTILDFVRRSGLAEVQYTLLTPFPGTPLQARLRREGRLLADRYWDACTLFDVTYRPKRMSEEDLAKGLEWLFRETYGPKVTSHRLRQFLKQRTPRESGLN